MAQSQRLPLWMKCAHGSGAMSYGIKDAGFNYFFLLFYSQVIGLDTRLAGLALTIALVFDALSDPIVGYWSDNLRSRWGRRHPFMYLSAVPVAATYFLFWNPPHGWSQMALFWYVLGLAILIRTFITFFETPSAALTPELTRDYEERSTLFSFRLFFGWTGGNASSVTMFLLVFPAFATPLITDGRFNRDAYAFYGMIASLFIFCAIMGSALATHAYIPRLSTPPARKIMRVGEIFREIIHTLVDRSYIALFVAALFGAIAAGISAGLTFIMLTYFWEFSTQQIGLYTLSVFLSALMGALMAPLVTRFIGKKRAAIIIGLIAFLGQPVPIILRLFDVLPANGTDFTFWFVLIVYAIDLGFIICFQILSMSMMADMVEQGEMRTGRRSEGIFFASITFIRKSVTGLGILIAGLIMAYAGLPEGTAPADVPDAAIWRLGAYYVPVILTFWMLMIIAISFYNIDRKTHEDTLRRLADT